MVLFKKIAEKKYTGRLKQYESAGCRVPGARSKIE